MRQETKSSMIPSILNDNKQKTYSNREKLIPIEQSSLNRPECDICDMGSCCNKRVADQKQKIRELIKNTRDNVTQRDSAQFVLIRLLREFEELK